MAKNAARQICIKLPVSLIERADRLARKVVLPNGLKYTKTSQLRDWLIRGSKIPEDISNCPSTTMAGESTNAQAN